MTGPPSIDKDISLLLTAAAAGVDAAILEHLKREGFADLRYSHGFIFQHLVPGAISVRDLAAKLGMTPQGASKAVIELETMGYVRRDVSVDDRRAHLISLTDKGRRAIDVSRVARAEAAAAVEAILGRQDAGTLRDLLRKVAAGNGGLEALGSRRLRPPR